MTFPFPKLEKLTSLISNDSFRKPGWKNVEWLANWQSFATFARNWNEKNDWQVLPLVIID